MSSLSHQHTYFRPYLPPTINLCNVNIPPLLGLIFFEFDNILGPTVVAQYPDNILSPSTFRDYSDLVLSSSDFSSSVFTVHSITNAPSPPQNSQTSSSPSQSGQTAFPSQYATTHSSTSLLPGQHSQQHSMSLLSLAHQSPSTVSQQPPYTSSTAQQSSPLPSKLSQYTQLPQQFRVITYPTVINANHYYRNSFFFAFGLIIGINGDPTFYSSLIVEVGRWLYKLEVDKGMLQGQTERTVREQKLEWARFTQSSTQSSTIVPTPAYSALPTQQQPVQSVLGTNAADSTQPTNSTSTSTLNQSNPTQPSTQPPQLTSIGQNQQSQQIQQQPQQIPTNAINHMSLDRLPLRQHVLHLLCDLLLVQLPLTGKGTITTAYGHHLSIELPVVYPCFSYCVDYSLLKKRLIGDCNSLLTQLTQHQERMNSLSESLTFVSLKLQSIKERWEDGQRGDLQRCAPFVQHFTQHNHHQHHPSLIPLQQSCETQRTQLMDQITQLDGKMQKLYAELTSLLSFIPTQCLFQPIKPSHLIDIENYINPNLLNFTPVVAEAISLTKSQYNQLLQSFHHQSLSTLTTPYSPFSSNPIFVSLPPYLKTTPFSLHSTPMRISSRLRLPHTTTLQHQNHTLSTTFLSSFPNGLILTILDQIDDRSTLLQLLRNTTTIHPYLFLTVLRLFINSGIVVLIDSVLTTNTYVFTPEWQAFITNALNPSLFSLDPHDPSELLQCNNVSGQPFHYCTAQQPLVAEVSNVITHHKMNLYSLQATHMANLANIYDEHGLNSADLQHSLKLTQPMHHLNNNNPSTHANTFQQLLTSTTAQLDGSGDRANASLGQTTNASYSYKQQCTSPICSVLIKQALMYSTILPQYPSNLTSESEQTHSINNNNNNNNKTNSPSPFSSPQNQNSTSTQPSPPAPSAQKIYGLLQSAKAIKFLLSFLSPQQPQLSQSRQNVSKLQSTSHLPPSIRAKSTYHDQLPTLANLWAASPIPNVDPIRFVSFFVAFGVLKRVGVGIKLKPSQIAQSSNNFHLPSISSLRYDFPSNPVDLSAQCTNSYQLETHLGYSEIEQTRRQKQPHPAFLFDLILTTSQNITNQSPSLDTPHSEHHPRHRHHTHCNQDPPTDHSSPASAIDLKHLLGESIISQLDANLARNADLTTSLHSLPQHSRLSPPTSISPTTFLSTLVNSQQALKTPMFSSSESTYPYISHFSHDQHSLTPNALLQLALKPYNLSIAFNFNSVVNLKPKNSHLSYYLPMLQPPSPTFYSSLSQHFTLRKFFIALQKHFSASISNNLDFSGLSAVFPTFPHQTLQYIQSSFFQAYNRSSPCEIPSENPTLSSTLLKSFLSSATQQQHPFHDMESSNQRQFLRFLALFFVQPTASRRSPLKLLLLSQNSSQSLSDRFNSQNNLCYTQLTKLDTNAAQSHRFDLADDSSSLDHRTLVISRMSTVNNSNTRSTTPISTRHIDSNHPPHPFSQTPTAATSNQSSHHGHGVVNRSHNAFSQNDIAFASSQNNNNNNNNNLPPCHPIRSSNITGNGEDTTDHTTTSNSLTSAQLDHLSPNSSLSVSQLITMDSTRLKSHFDTSHTHNGNGAESNFGQNAQIASNEAAVAASVAPTSSTNEPLHPPTHSTDSNLKQTPKEGKTQNQLSNHPTHDKFFHSSISQLPTPQISRYPSFHKQTTAPPATHGSYLSGNMMNMHTMHTIASNTIPTDELSAPPSLFATPSTKTTTINDISVDDHQQRFPFRQQQQQQQISGSLNNSSAHCSNSSVPSTIGNLYSHFADIFPFASTNAQFPTLSSSSTSSTTTSSTYHSTSPLHSTFQHITPSKTSLFHHIYPDLSLILLTYPAAKVSGLIQQYRSLLLEIRDTLPSLLFDPTTLPPQCEPSILPQATSINDSSKTTTTFIENSHTSAPHKSILGASSNSIHPSTTTSVLVTLPSHREQIQIIHAYQEQLRNLVTQLQFYFIPLSHQPLDLYELAQSFELCTIQLYNLITQIFCTPHFFLVQHIMEPLYQSLELITPTSTGGGNNFVGDSITAVAKSKTAFDHNINFFYHRLASLHSLDQDIDSIVDRSGDENSHIIQPAIELTLF